MTKIYLIRHAESKPTGHDATRWPLSERGEQQAVALAAQAFWSEIVAIVSSDEPKAMASVQDVAIERGIPLLTRECLRELKRTSAWLDDYEERVREAFESPARSIGGWERATDAQVRVLACVDECKSVLLDCPPRARRPFLTR